MIRKHNCFIFLFFFVIHTFLFAGINRFEVESKKTIVITNKSGQQISYEIIKGVMYFEIDPNNDLNKKIVDLEFANTNQNGLVEYNSEFELHFPTDDDHSNKRLIYFVNNRGNKIGEWHFNSNYDGNWLFDNGYSYLWCGWNADVIESDHRLNINVPIAYDDKSSIRGKIYSEMISYSNEIVYDRPIVWGGSTVSPPLNLDNSTASLSKRKYREDNPIIISNNDWQFGRLENGVVVPDLSRVYIKDGFEPGWLYDLIYEGKDPKIVGIGLAAIRDVVSFFRYDYSDSKGNPNPLAGKIQYSFAWGHSQSARLLNHFVYQNFNLNEEKRIVFDGVMMNCPGAGKGLFNSRFAQLTRHGSHHEDRLYPIDFFPFATVEQIDLDGKHYVDPFQNARDSNSMPKLMFINSSTDYWTRAASLLHTDVLGSKDLPIDEDVRIYSVSGIAHTEDRIGIIGRALLTALDSWVSNGIKPPDSKIPRISDGTLVNITEFRKKFPELPSVRYPKSVYEPYKLYMGPRWSSKGIADIQPPKIIGKYNILVPQVDVDGNEIAGIRLPEVDVPFATYTGWSMRDPQFSNTMRRNAGNIIPFSLSKADRLQNKDPRISIIERYANKDEYISKVEISLLQLQNQGFILSEDYTYLLVEAAFRDYWNYSIQSKSSVKSIELDKPILRRGEEAIIMVQFDGDLDNIYKVKCSLREANNLEYFLNDTGINGDASQGDGIWSSKIRMPLDIPDGTYNFDITSIDNDLINIYIKPKSIKLEERSGFIPMTVHGDI